MVEERSDEFEEISSLKTKKSIDQWMQTLEYIILNHEFDRSSIFTIFQMKTILFIDHL